MRYSHILVVLYSVLTVHNTTHAQLIEKQSIPIDESILLGKVHHLTVSKNHIALVDITSNVVHVINKGGKLVKTIRASDCYPGLRDAPINTQIVQDSTLVILNAVEPGIIYHLNYGCDRVLNPEILLGDITFFDPSKQLLMTRGIGPIEAGNVIFNLHYLLNNKKAHVVLEKLKYPRLFLRYTYGGIVKMHRLDQDVYVLALTGHDQLLVFDEQKLLGHISLKIPELRFPKEDIPAQKDVNPMGFMKQMFELMSTHHFIHNVFAGEEISSSQRKLYVVLSNPTAETAGETSYSILELILDVVTLKVSQHRLIPIGRHYPNHIEENVFYSFAYGLRDTDPATIEVFEF